MKTTATDRTIALRKLAASPSPALFVGPRGSGRTRAAQEIAGMLGVELRRVDLSRLASRYIGETEKNIDRLFDEAARDGAVLIFDEVDALFGKRTEVRDAHDRYANIEVDYLLAKIEAHPGLTIVTTNHREAIDPAFLRRLRPVIEFHSPEDPGG
jgi:SpoVK/Ycf46/Vps4 family AAA+-type ATPase